MSISQIKQQLHHMADPVRAEVSQRFFKTGPGQYGAGDRFLGITVPNLRKLAKAHIGLAPAKVAQLLASPIHEQRMAALLIWTYQFVRVDHTGQAQIHHLYLDHTPWINNWDLVDVTAPHIVGGFLIDKDKQPLIDLAGSDNLWKRRIAMIATFYFIRRHQFKDTLLLADVLIADDHDLIHKAVGWMLREVGNRDQPVLEEYLMNHYNAMPRTMLRYAIEKLPESRRQDYLKGRVT